MPVVMWLAMALLAAPRNAAPVTAVVDSALTAADRERVIGALKDTVERSARFRWVEAPPLSSDELVLAMGCGGLNEACARGLSSMLKVDALMFVTLRNSVLSVTLYKNKGGRGGQAFSVAWSDGAASVTSLRQQLQPLLGPLKPATLSITTTPPGCEVSVDGILAGHGPLTLDSVAEGTHSLTIQDPGGIPQTLQVELRAGQTTTIDVLVPRRPVATSPPSPPPVTPEPTDTAPKAIAASPSSPAPPAPTTPPGAPAPETASAPPARGSSSGPPWRSLLGVAGAVAVAASGPGVVLSVGAAAAYASAYGVMLARAQANLLRQSGTPVPPVTQRQYVMFRQLQYPLLAVSVAAAGMSGLVAIALVAAGLAMAGVTFVIPSADR